jgi:hypothetical protein
MMVFAGGPTTFSSSRESRAYILCFAGRCLSAGYSLSAAFETSHWGEHFTNDLSRTPRLLVPVPRLNHHAQDLYSQM